MNNYADNGNSIVSHYISIGETMTVEELELLGTLSEIDLRDIDDDTIADLLEEALEITDEDPYEAITFITENSEIPYEDLQRVYDTFKK